MGLQQFISALRIREVRVPAVDQNVALFEIRDELVNRVVGWFAGFHHNQNFTGRFERLYEFLNVVGADEIFTRRFLQQLFGFLRRAVVQGNGEAVAFDI
ncbi:hypothetical protein D3C81_1865610 [compost metagenome]